MFGRGACNNDGSTVGFDVDVDFGTASTTGGREKRTQTTGGA